jgi:hypothetical protein
MPRRKGSDYTAWEDVAIMTCWRAGEPWRECAWKIGKTEGAVRERWRRLMRSYVQTQPSRRPEQA